VCVGLVGGLCWGVVVGVVVCGLGVGVWVCGGVWGGGGGVEIEGGIDM